MSSPRTKRLIITVAAAAGLVTLIACGSKSEPTTSPTDDPGNGGVVVASISPDAETSAQPSNAAPSTSSSSKAQTSTSPYPGTASAYGLEILKAVDAPNETRVVDLSSSSTFQYISQQNYPAKNASWTSTNCRDAGDTQMCAYFNTTGDIAVVGVQEGLIGKAHAVSSVSITGGSFPTNAGGYILSFAGSWDNLLDDTSYARMWSLSSKSVADHFKGVQPLTKQGAAGVSYSGTHPCTNNSSKTCIDLTPVGGTANPAPVQFVIDANKIGQGKPGGITGWV